MELSKCGNNLVAYEYEGGATGLKKTYDFDHTFLLWAGSIDARGKDYRDHIEIIPVPYSFANNTTTRIQIKKTFSTLTIREKKLLILRIAFNYGIPTESLCVKTLLESLN